VDITINRRSFQPSLTFLVKRVKIAGLCVGFGGTMLNAKYWERNGFVPLTVSPGKDPLPEDTAYLLEQALAIGHSFGKGLIKHPLSDGVGISQRGRSGSLAIQKEIEEIMDELFGSYEPKTALIIKLALLTGIGDCLVSRRKRHFSRYTIDDLLTFSAMRHCLFPQVLMTLTREERVVLFDTMIELHRAKPWSQAYSSGLAVARLAHLLNQHGFKTWQTPLYFDVNQGGDLVASAGREYWYIQVKAVSKIYPTTFYHLTGRPSGKVASRLWFGAEQFASHTGLPTVPVLALISMGGYNLGNVEDCYSTAEAFRTFLRSQRHQPSLLQSPDAIEVQAVSAR